MIEYGGEPADWVTRGGAPARCLGNPAKHGGMPSYEDEDGRFVVYDLVACKTENLLGMMALSRFYGVACIVAPEDTVPLHHSPEAMWVYRPLLYRIGAHGGWSRLGSQQELGWRYGLGQMQMAMAAVDAGEFDPETDFTMAKADERADKLLEENLSGLQLTELKASDSFKVRGGKTKNFYRVELGNGFEIINGVTEDTGVSYCLHPDYWMPMADVALAIKFQLEDEELEEETVNNARPTVYWENSPPTHNQVVAYRMEKDLIT